MSEQNKSTADNWSHRSATMLCSTCMWFVRKDAYNHPEDTEQVAPKMQFGRCRRHAPVVQHGWPAVYGSDWCGDHKLDSEKLKHGAKVS